MNEETKPKKPIWKKWWLWIGIILVIIIIASSGGENGKKSEESQMPFSQQEITETSVRNAVENLSGVSVDIKGNITKVELFGSVATPESKTVHIYYKPSSWDAKHAMTTAIHTAIETMEALFKNPNVEEVVMWQQGDFTDTYGNTNVETAIRITMDKETADKIASWDTIDERAWADEQTFFDLAELQYVHPALQKDL